MQHLGAAVAGVQVGDFEQELVGGHLMALSALRDETSVRPDAAVQCVQSR